jgi:hypothetical protein
MGWMLHEARESPVGKLVIFFSEFADIRLCVSTG